MERYTDKLKELESKHKKLEEKLCTLILNIREDQPEGMFTRNQYATRLGDIHKSILYRINSIRWHIYNLCHYHSAYEKKLYDNSNPNNTLSLCSLYSSYIFDDFIFNLISLYDYFGSCFYIAFANETQPKKTWRSLAKLCSDKNNDFYYCKLAENIRNHNRTWVQKIEDFRASVIHYGIKRGEFKVVLSDHCKYGRKDRIICALPDEIVKILPNNNNHQINEIGIDLQFGTIEIWKETLESLYELSEIANNTCTSKFQEKNTLIGITPKINPSNEANCKSGDQRSKFPDNNPP
uniref:hypothetical protein n=1 Tax=Candidatus Electronema sp. TaxID=2698783 RepID=UPI0040575985